MSVGFDDDELDTYASIYERDVDLFVVCALRTSESVLELFCNSVGLSRGTAVHVRHSLTTGDGREADIELRVRIGDEVHVFQVENKLDDVFQDGQPEAYAERVRTLATQEDFSSAHSILLAPRAYLETANCDPFDAVFQGGHVEIDE